MHRPSASSSKSALVLALLTAAVASCGASAQTPASAPSPSPEPASVAPKEAAAASSAAPQPAAAAKAECSEGTDPCPAPDASALPAAGTLCFRTPIMGTVMCANATSSCEDLRKAAIRVGVKNGEKEADMETALGPCSDTYFCMTAADDEGGKPTAHCYEKMEYCLTNAGMGGASGCVAMGAK